MTKYVQLYVCMQAYSVMMYCIWVHNSLWNFMQKLCVCVRFSHREKANSDLLDYESWGGGGADITGTKEFHVLSSL